MKKYELTPDNIGDYMICYGSDFPLKIDDKAGLDFKDKETKAIPHDSCIYQKKSKTRCVKLEITSFRGISWGAIHFYGKMVADGIDFQMLDNPKITTSNWEAKKINPFYQWRYEFDLRRPTTEEEINNDPDRWHGYHPGSFTTSFDTKEEIIALAKECFKMRFTGKWELWVEDCATAKTTVYQIKFEEPRVFSVGNRVRNKLSGCSGVVKALPYSEKHDWLTVQVVTQSGKRNLRKWSLKNVELIDI